MTSQTNEELNPHGDTNQPGAPGGVDASPSESDTGMGREPELLTPDQPLAAQTDQADVPDAIQEPENDEPAEQATDNTEAEQAPSG